MTIKDLLDVYDRNRDYDYQWLKFMNGNGEVTAEITSNSEILDYMQDAEIESISAEENSVIGVWLKDNG